MITSYKGSIKLGAFPCLKTVKVLAPETLLHGLSVYFHKKDVILKVSPSSLILPL
jgi:hypothetical protein